ncbi:helix-turn-helix domain-containing protein [Caballeronia sp. LjRoot34]
MTPDKQEEFARLCGTTIGYLRKAISTGQQLGESLCINIDRESAGGIRCEELARSVDWAYLRGTGSSVHATEAA